MRHTFLAPHLLIVAAALGAVTLPAAAQVTDIRVEQVPQDVVPDVVVHDVLIDFERNIFRGAEILLELDAGSIYQDPWGGDGAPYSGFFEFAPSIEFDTFLSFGGSTSFEADVAQVGINGGAYTLSSIFDGRRHTFDSSGIDIQYFIPGGAFLGQQRDYFVARITLSDEAAGRFRFVAFAGGTQSPVFDVPIQNGVILPEPAAASFLVALLAPALHSRRSRG